MTRASVPAHVPEVWPPRAELETWLFNAASDPDPAAVALRRLVQTNPGYGAYLAEDKEITEVVQSFARRFRKRILESASPIQPEVLYKPLCEVMWKSVALVLNQLEEITSAPPPPDSSERNCGTGPESLIRPLPRDVRGQLRMLLQTNEELSTQLNDLRRAYLKELSEHRDRQRRLSAKVQFALDSLQEEPIMFYEPLNSILDQTTKDFVTRTVEERIKLEMRVALQRNEDEADVDDTSEQLQSLEEEVKRLRVNVSKEAENRWRAEEAAAKWKAEAEEAKRLLQEALAAAENAKRELQEEKQASEQHKRRLTMLEQQQQQQQSNSGTSGRNSNSELIAQLGERDDLIRELQQRLDQMSSQLKARDEELAAAIRNAQERQEPHESATTAHASKGKHSQAPQAKESAIEKAAEQKTPKAKRRDDAVESSGTKAAEKDKAVDNASQKMVIDDAALREAREELEKHLQIEIELRETIRRLEKALQEAESRTVDSSSDAAKRNSAKIMVADQGEEDLQEVINNLNKLHAKELQERDNEIRRLNALLEELETGSGDEAGGAPKKKMSVKRGSMRADDAEERIAKWRAKCEELETQYDEVQHEKEVLEQKVEELIKKLREKIGDDELKETLLKIDSTPLAPKKKKKRNCFERLYDDAQRRIQGLREQAANLAQAQEAELKAAARRIKTMSDLNRLNMLANLQRASQLTNQRFQSAMQRFNKLPSVPEDAQGEQEVRCAISCPCPNCGTIVTPGSEATMIAPTSGGASFTATAAPGIFSTVDNGLVVVGTSEPGPRDLQLHAQRNLQLAQPDASQRGPGLLRDVTPLQGHNVSLASAAPQNEYAANAFAAGWRQYTSMTDEGAMVQSGPPDVTATSSAAAAYRRLESAELSPVDIVDGVPFSPVSVSSVSSRSAARGAPQADLPTQAEAEAALHRLGRASPTKKDQLQPLDARASPTKHSPSQSQPQLYGQQPLQPQPVRGVTLRALAEDMEAVPCPPPTMSPSPVSPLRPGAMLRNEQMTRSFIANVSQTVPSGPWAIASHGGSMMMKSGNTRSLPSLSSAKGKVLASGMPSHGVAIVNRAWEVPKRASAKTSKQRLWEAEKTRGFSSLVQGQEIAS